MKLHSLTTQNFRRFDQLQMEFDPGLTVISARNGQGKTSVLEAAVIALAPFVAAFETERVPSLQESDARLVVLGRGPENEPQFPVIVSAQLRDPAMEVSHEVAGPDRRSTRAETAELSAYGRQLALQVQEDAELVLPVIRFFSSKRLWVHHRRTERRNPVLTQSRTAGYADCLSEASSFNQLQDWLEAATLADLQQAQRGVDTPLKGRLAGIRRAVETVLAEEEWSDFHYSLTFEELALVHPDHGELPLSRLSDGVRAMTALAADLAQRCARLNGHLGETAPRRTPGIVLIDELDLHLHPAWQQRVVGALRSAFPLVQFIVTTHSPQVLSTVSSENIRIVDQDEKGAWVVETPSREVIGLASSVALNEVMEVSPVPRTHATALASRYRQLIEQGLHETKEALEVRSELEDIYGPLSPELRDFDRSIRFQRFKAGAHAEG